MGYRSQVAGIFSVNRVTKQDAKGASYQEYDKAKFKEMIGFIKLSKFYDSWSTTEDDRQCFGWDDGFFIFHGDGFKWYREYQDVKDWYEMWNAMQNIEGISGYFCRVGEESDDVEMEEFGDDPCYDFFYPRTYLDFSAENFLGKRVTDEEETKKEDTATAQPDCAGANHATQAQ